MRATSQHLDSIGCSLVPYPYFADRHTVSSGIRSRRQHKAQSLSLFHESIFPPDWYTLARLAPVRATAALSGPGKPGVSQGELRANEAPDSADLKLACHKTLGSVTARHNSVTARHNSEGERSCNWVAFKHDQLRYRREERKGEGSGGERDHHGLWGSLPLFVPLTHTSQTQPDSPPHSDRRPSRTTHTASSNHQTQKPSTSPRHHSYRRR